MIGYPKSAKGILPVALGLALMMSMAAPALAEDMTPYAMINKAAAEQPVVAHTLRGGVTELEGSGGNIGVYAGPTHDVSSGTGSPRSAMIGIAVEDPQSP